MAADFTHLHLHTAYSLLDGAIRLDRLFPRLAEHGMKSVAMTDHGNMFGAVDFYKQAKKHGVKPIFGIETYVAAGDRREKTPASRKSFHLVLLAKNEVGYKNLQYLSSKAYLEGKYYNPRVDKQLLKERSEGLVASSACLGGEIAQTLLRDGYDKAKDKVREYASLFEPGHFFLEVQPNGLEEQESVNGEYRKLSRDTGVPVVATGDCHYVTRDDYKAHEVLMCIQQKKTIHEPRRLHHKVSEFYIKSEAEMAGYFGDWGEPLENAARIGQMCNVELELGKNLLPRYQVPDGHDLDSYCARTAHEGLARRLQEKHARGETFDPDEYRERLDHELGIITKMGFSGYFLIVWDFIRWAKEQRIPVGPGRGSGAGSVAAWSLRITDVDPLPFKLLFERFLNPDRVSMPDFDIDFCMDQRDKVIAYVTDKYGKDNVGQIATFHQLKSRGCVRDVARALAIPLAEADKIAKLIPEPRQGKPPAIDQAIAEEPRLKELYKNDGRVKELLDFAKSLENLNRHAGMHAAGIVIADRPLWELVPCFDGGGDALVTQYAKEEVEEAGLVKFDFLGLKTLTVIDKAVKLVNRARPDDEPELSIDTIPLDDPRVYKLIAAGDTTGVFQLESSGMREMLKKLKPDCLEDIVAAVALYRPGPMDMIPEFIDRKHGRKRIAYLHPLLEPILNDTYGIIVYQEQVMQIAQALAGYSLGGADLLRRAMGKKKVEAMDAQRGKFLAGGTERGIDEKIGAQVFDLVAEFAKYGFNRSHAAAYGLVTYQTAYLKAHHPHEFMAGLLSCDRDNTDNIVKFIAEARQMDLEVARPDINESQLDFAVVNRTAEDGSEHKMIRFGLAAVRGVGEGAVEDIVKVRDTEPFGSVFDFCRRIDAQRVNRRVVEALVKAGAFDGVGAAQGVTRSQQFLAVELALERAARDQRDKKIGQTSLFGLAEFQEASPDDEYAEVEEWAPKELLAHEKDSLGFYITGHPLDAFQADLSRYASHNSSELEEAARREAEVSIGGVVTDYKDRPTKSGNGRWAVFRLEDQYGSVEVLAFRKAYDNFHPVLTLEEPLLIRGQAKLEDDGSSFKIFMSEAAPLAQLRADRTREVHIRLDADGTTKEQLVELKKLLASHPGPCRTFLHLRIPMRSESTIPLPELEVTPSEELLMRLERLLGERVAVLR